MASRVGWRHLHGEWVCRQGPQRRCYWRLARLASQGPEGALRVPRRDPAGAQEAASGTPAWPARLRRRSLGAAQVREGAPHARHSSRASAGTEALQRETEFSSCISGASNRPSRSIGPARRGGFNVNRGNKAALVLFLGRKSQLHLG